jgi:hypothetical protein
MATPNQYSPAFLTLLKQIAEPRHTFDADDFAQQPINVKRDRLHAALTLYADWFADIGRHEDAGSFKWDEPERLRRYLNEEREDFVARTGMVLTEIRGLQKPELPGDLE